MTYPGHTWVDDDTSKPLSAARIGEIEAALIRAHNQITIPQAIAYAATITPDASAGSLFYCVATGNLALTDPTNGTDGKHVTVAVQASGGSRTLTLPDSTTVTIASGEWYSLNQVYLATPNVWLSTDGV